MSAPFTVIGGGITAPRGFVAAAGFCGIKPGNKARPDLAVIYSEAPAVAAATFTTNRVKAAPVRVSSEHVRNGDIQAVVVNSGNANACTGCVGIENAKRMTRATAAELDLKERQVLVCSTGRIGVQLPIEKIEAAIPRVVKNLDREGSLKAARAIMTSDTFSKEIAVEFDLGGKTVRIGGIAKGAGMIDPNMATMLCFLTTDAAVSKQTLQQALSAAVGESFNRITIDGDMSTNDAVLLLANGEAHNRPRKLTQPQFRQFQAALNHVAGALAKMIVEDGEGVTKFIELCVLGASNEKDARRAAEAVANSALVKCSWFGNDPNWGRIMDAIGYSGAKLREELVDIFYEGAIAVKNGMASETPFEKLQDIVRAPRFKITIDLHLGSAEYSVFTTDLSTRYVELNMGE